MRSLQAIPAEDKKHFIQCSLCDHYYDVRDRAQRLIHAHIQHPAIASELATRRRNASLAAPPVQPGSIDLRKAGR